MTVIGTGQSHAAAITALYTTYQRPMLAHLVRLVSDREAAEDLCQDAFLKALRGWERRDPAGNEQAWLYRIATNTAYDYLRRRRRIHFSSLLDTDQPPDLRPSLELLFDEQDMVQRVLDQLPPQYRKPLVQFTRDGWSLQEIADALGCSHSAAKLRLFRARRHFRQIYRKQQLLEEC